MAAASFPACHAVTSRPSLHALAAAATAAFGGFMLDYHSPLPAGLLFAIAVVNGLLAVNRPGRSR